MIITSGHIIKPKELRISFEDMCNIYNRTESGQNFRIKGLDGDVVFYAQDYKGYDFVIEVEQQT